MKVYDTDQENHEDLRGLYVISGNLETVILISEFQISLNTFSILYYLWMT